MCKLAVLFSVLIMLGFFGAAQDGKTENSMDLTKVETLQDLPEEKTGLRKILPAYEVAFAEFLFQPSNDIKNIDDTEFDLLEYRLGFVPNFEIMPEVYLGLGVTYSAYNFHFQFPGGVGNDYRTLHSLSFPISLTYMHEKWLFSGQISTSLNSDFRGFNRHDAQINGGAIVGYLFHPTFFLQFGLFATNDFGDLNVIPAGGFVWKPDSSFDISLLIPFIADINFHLNEKFTLFAHYELDGNQFRFRYREFGEEFEEDGQFTFYRFGLGAKYEFVDGVSFKLTLGGTSDGRYEFRGLSTEEKSGRIRGTFYMLVGITIDENLFK